MEKVRIRLEGISKSYYAKTAVTQALHKINLTFRTGEFVAITGESGSGKSTLLNIIGGMDSFDDGEMFVDGEPTFQYDEADWEEYRRNKIGYVFQDYSLIGHYSVLDNMISGLLIMGKSKQEAEEEARDYLKLVGLEGYETHRATELSSGQKQRLSIARALAKNTGIIVADEPTGNLDSEKGEQIMALLKELSKGRLVIMVTHNYEQAKAYVTRKIRIHDGKLVLDVPVKEGIEGTATEENEGVTLEQIKEPKEAQESPRDFRFQNRIAAYFAGKNMRTQPGRAVLFTTFLFIISAASFLLLGELFMHQDDIYTKSYDGKAFYQECDTRLVVKQTDGSEITDEELAKIEKLSNVVTADSCDYANDINYYIEEEKDYTYMYSYRRKPKGDDSKVVEFLHEDNFMRSTDCITEADLAYGRLPEARNEIVLYGEDDSELGQNKLCYFTAANIWDTNEYYQTELQVVGILKEETKQIYFAEELCEILSMHMDSGVYRLYYEYDHSKQDYLQKPEFIPVVSDDLRGNEMRLSKKSEAPVVGTVLFHFQDYLEDGSLSKEAVECEVTVLEEKHSSTVDFVEVSQEFYDKYYQPEKVQASVYITSYAKTDTVMKQLRKMGYEPISTFRLGTTEYVTSLVYERLKIMGIALGGLVALLIAEILILRSLMKIRLKDYFVLKFIGMKMQMIRKISYWELLTYCLAAIFLTVICMHILRVAGIPIVCEMMWYYGIGAYLVFALYNLVLTGLTVAAFNHLVKGRLNA